MDEPSRERDTTYRRWWRGKVGTCLTQSIERKTHYITIYISEFNHRFSVIIPEIYIINSALNMANVQILLRFPCTVLGDFFYSPFLVTYSYKMFVFYYKSHLYTRLRDKNYDLYIKFINCCPSLISNYLLTRCNRCTIWWFCKTHKVLYFEKKVNNFFSIEQWILPISLFPKEITVHSGIVWRDKIYGDRRQICERVEVSTIKYQLFRRPKMKYLLFTLNF